MSQSFENQASLQKSMSEVFNDADLLFDAAEVEKSISLLADNISQKLSETLPVLICVMNGGLILTGKLAPRLGFPLEIDYIHATRYRGETQGGDLIWKQKPQLDIQDRTVLVIDDILDEGHTLHAILQYCQNQGAKSVYSAVLVDKHHDRKAFPGFKADFYGLEVEDRYVFGYGMDYHGYWRNAPGIYAVKGL